MTCELAIAINHQAHQNMSNLFYLSKQTKNAKSLTMPTYVVDMCTNITKKIENQMYVVKLIFYNSPYFFEQI
jgi:hypothetical protein